MPFILDVGSKQRIPEAAPAPAPGPGHLPVNLLRLGLGGGPLPFPPLLVFVAGEGTVSCSFPIRGHGRLAHSLSNSLVTAFQKRTPDPQRSLSPAERSQ